MTKQPSYRFMSYVEPWEEKKLSDGISKIGDGIHGTPVYSEDGDYYFINGNNLVDGKIFLFPETKKVQSNQLTVSDTSLKKNTILMSINGTIGSLAWYRDEKVMLGKSVAYLTTEEFNKKFIYSILQTPKIVKHFNNNLTGTTIKNLGLKTIRDTVISLPSLPEQTAIGSYFQDIDQLISLQQRKLEVLKEQKKTYLKLLFPAKGQTKPALRFAGFEDEWQRQNFGDYLVEYNEKTVVENQHELLSSTNNGIEPRVGRVSGESNLGYKVLKKDMIVLSPQNLWLGNINYNSNYDLGIVSPSYKIFNIENVDKKFIATLIRHPYMNYEYGQASVQGASVVRRNLDIDLFNGIQIFLPSLEEQSLIGSFFQDLDKAIAKQEEKVNQLKESKQTLLRKMFI